MSRYPGKEREVSFNLLRFYSSRYKTFIRCDLPLASIIPPSSKKIYIGHISSVETSMGGDKDVWENDHMIVYHQTSIGFWF
jgi:hypothetical protein